MSNCRYRQTGDVSERDGTRVDMHVKVLDERVVERAKARGVDVLVYAPHFMRLPEIERRAEAHSDDGLLVVPAREVFTGSWRERKHVLAIGLSDPVPDFVTLEAAMAEFNRQDAAVVAPHPEFLTVGLTAADLREYREVVDAVEVYNPKCWPRHTRRAREIATAVDRPVAASSYAHLRRTVGAAWTAFDREIESETDLVTALRELVPRWTDQRSDLEHRLESAAEFSHLGWENTWKKLDRILLSGTEATHPNQDAYGDRFADAAVY
jgi:predicted metal-dependent phosphoesterase TrpH